MSFMEKPYVGVTGPASSEEVSGLLDIFKSSGLSHSSRHMPMIGFLVSYKSLEFGYNPGDMRYPKIKDLAGLLSKADGEAFTTIHYNTKTPSHLYDEVRSVLETDGIYDSSVCEGLQINVAWPPKDQVDMIRMKFSDLKTILQLPKSATSDMAVDDIAYRVVHDYPDMEYILIDPSGGRGEEFDVSNSALLYKKLKDVGFSGAIGLAGGLSGDNVSSVIDAVIKTTGSRDFSIDAEGRLRDSFGDKPGESVLNLSKARAYVLNAAASLNKL